LSPDLTGSQDPEDCLQILLGLRIQRIVSRFYWVSGSRGLSPDFTGSPDPEDCLQILLGLRIQRIIQVNLKIEICDKLQKQK